MNFECSALSFDLRRLIRNALHSEPIVRPLNAYSFKYKIEDIFWHCVTISDFESVRSVLFPSIRNATAIEHTLMPAYLGFKWYNFERWWCNHQAMLWKCYLCILYKWIYTVAFVAGKISTNLKTNLDESNRKDHNIITVLYEFINMNRISKWSSTFHHRNSQITIKDVTFWLLLLK